MHLDPTWAQERIIKIIEALGKKAKLSIICEFCFGTIVLALITLKLSVGVAIWVFSLFYQIDFQSLLVTQPLFKYADEPPSQTLLNWSSDFEEIWGVRIQDLSRRQLGLGQQLRAQFAPPPPMPPLPTARVHTSISPVSRAGSDVSPPLAVPPPNYIPQGRMPHDTLFHSLSSSSHAETRIQIAHDVREKEVRSMVNDADIDPALQAVSNARLQATVALPVPVPPAPSLPSLKASGLLEWPHPGSTDAVVVPSTVQSSVNWQPPTQYFVPSRQPQRESVRSFNVQSTPDGPRPPAPSASSGMPVGLQWLAHESSVSKPS